MGINQEGKKDIKNGIGWDKKRIVWVGIVKGDLI